MDHYWLCHDPTQLNKQGADMGTQYRSVIFYINDEQRNVAEISKQNFQKKIANEIMTEITKFSSFYLAEDYHQLYIQKKS